MRQLKTLLAVVGGATILVLAGNTIALATTGHSLILGHNNSANTYTGITRTTSGSALKLTTTSSSNSPLTVNGKGKVANLNADTVDGIDSTALKNHAYVITTSLSTAATDLTIDANVPAGSYLVAYTAYLSSSPSTALDDVDCSVVAGDNSGSTYTADSAFRTDSPFASASGAGIVTKPATASGFIHLGCVAIDPSDDSEIPFITVASVPAQLTLTRIDSVSTTTASRTHAH